MNCDPERTELMEPLTFEQVHAVNTARCRRWHEDSTAWTGADWATALGGECGEALNIVKKLRRVECGMDPGPNDPPAHELGKMLADELADVFLYLDLLAWHYGIDLVWSIVSKFNEVSARQGFPEELPWPALDLSSPMVMTPCPFDGCPYPTNPKYSHDHPMDNPGPPICGGDNGVCAWNPTCHAVDCVNYRAPHNCSIDGGGLCDEYPNCLTPKGPN